MMMIVMILTFSRDLWDEKKFNLWLTVNGEERRKGEKRREKDRWRNFGARFLDFRPRLSATADGRQRRQELRM